MRIAVEAAERVRGSTSPNPPVGCVVLDAAGAVAGVGATRPPGGPHAEVVALGEAGSRAAGGTAVVTLEPCAHTGRTPPCTDALRAAGIARVRYAVADPGAAAGGGGALLRAAGLDVAGGLLAGEVAAGPLRAWLHRQRSGRPHVTWKYAASLDGRAAAADGSSRWISGPESRAEVHRIRAAADAVIAGTGTVLADDPRLTARGPDGEALPRQPLRVVVGDRPVPAGARVLDDAAPTLLLPGGDPAAVLAALAERDVVDVLLEGGPRLAGAFVAAGCVDRVLAYVAPVLLGAGPAALGPAGVASISGAWRWDVEGITMSGPDVRISAVPGPVDARPAR
ncbi:bifunctional diaminohydroxyphosphoribosylaminopyrimidine deaminase/5-amino-6-(5-phosphoribosylamino)uracil reductase RibD [Saccharopolyspora cebuensis]